MAAEAGAGGGRGKGGGRGRGGRRGGGQGQAWKQRWGRARHGSSGRGQGQGLRVCTTACMPVTYSSAAMYHGHHVPTTVLCTKAATCASQKGGTCVPQQCTTAAMCVLPRVYHSTACAYHCLHSSAYHGCRVPTVACTRLPLLACLPTCTTCCRTGASRSAWAHTLQSRTGTVAGPGRT